MEASEFRDLYEEFNKTGTVILGISKDSIKSHLNFIQKFELPFELLSDEEKTLHGIFDVLKAKKMYGKETIGTVRSTFVFDEKSRLVQEFRNVKTTGHAEEVLNYIRDNLDI